MSSLNRHMVTNRGIRSRRAGGHRLTYLLVGVGLPVPAAACQGRPGGRRGGERGAAAAGAAARHGTPPGSQTALSPALPAAKRRPSRPRFAHAASGREGGAPARLRAQRPCGCHARQVVQLSVCCSRVTVGLRALAQVDLALAWGLVAACCTHHLGHILHGLGWHGAAHGPVLAALAQPGVSLALGAAALAGPGRPLVVDGARALARCGPCNSSPCLTLYLGSLCDSSCRACRQYKTSFPGSCRVRSAHDKRALQAAAWRAVLQSSPGVSGRQVLPMTGLVGAPSSAGRTVGAAGAPRSHSPRRAPGARPT